jgi:hypothetical protein
MIHNKLFISQSFSTGIKTDHSDNRTLRITQAIINNDTGCLQLYVNKAKWYNKLCCYENELLLSELQNYFAGQNITGRVSFADKNLQTDKYLSFDVDKNFFINFYLKANETS